MNQLMKVFSHPKRWTSLLPHLRSPVQRRLSIWSPRRLPSTAVLTSRSRPLLRQMRCCLPTIPTIHRRVLPCPFSPNPCCRCFQLKDQEAAALNNNLHHRITSVLILLRCLPNLCSLQVQPHLPQYLPSLKSLCCRPHRAQAMVQEVNRAQTSVPTICRNTAITITAVPVKTQPPAAAEI